MESHLLQMRGLKPRRSIPKNLAFLSHLLQMRGLKRNMSILMIFRKSRIFYRCVD